MIVIAGLGNIGNQYANTYHNVGFMAVDYFAQKYGFEFTKTKYHSAYAEKVIEGVKVVILKPNTLMNLSGVAISECVKSFKLDLKDLLVVYDDIDIPKGTIRIRASGSAGTHNGMKNIISMLNSDCFSRLRIGTGKPDRPLLDYVLSKIDKESSELINSKMESISNIMLDFIKNDGNIEGIDVTKY